MKRKILLIFLGITLAFIVIEIFFRFVTFNELREAIRPYITGQDVLTCRKKDNILNHVLEPNCSGKVKTRDFNYVFKTNSLGLKSEEINKKKSKDTYRVVIVGDSYVEGWGSSQDESFPKISQDILRKKGYKIEVINAGVASYSPILELQYLIHYGLSLDPDLVIMMVDPNDMHDEYYYGGWELHNKIREELFPGTSGKITIWPKPDFPIIKNIISNSEFINLIYGRLKSMNDVNNKRLSIEDLTVNSEIYTISQDWKDFNKAFVLLGDTIVLTSDYLQEKKVDFALTTSSRGAYHNGREWDSGREVWGFKRGITYDPKPINEIKKIADKNNIFYINIFKELNESKKFPLFYSFDGHWTPAANGIVGTTVANYIEKKIKERVND